MAYGGDGDGDREVAQGVADGSTRTMQQGEFEQERELEMESS